MDSPIKKMQYQMKNTAPPTMGYGCRKVLPADTCHKAEHLANNSKMKYQSGNVKYLHITL